MWRWIHLLVLLSVLIFGMGGCSNDNAGTEGQEMGGEADESETDVVDIGDPGEPPEL